MPRVNVKSVSPWTFPWLVFVFFIQCFRIGEAFVPGPLDSWTSGSEPDSFLDPPQWSRESVPDFVLGTGNPSGLSNKLHTLDSFPTGLWHLAETQISKPQQHAFHSYVRNLSWRSNRLLRSCVGAPAPYRVGSSVAGSWTGVLCFGDCPLRSVPCVWPSDEYSSGRALISVAQIGTMQLSTATVYCPAKGPTFPNARALSEELLQSVTENLVFGREGPRAILGDFNCPAGHLQQMQVWQSLGWVELQNLMHQCFGIIPRPTCKNSTAPDQIWVSPELIPFVSNVAIWDIYPDHSMLVAGLHVPSVSRHSYQWHLPGHVPWSLVDFKSWEHDSDLGPILDSSRRPVGGHSLSLDSRLDFESVGQSESTEAFRSWSHDFEIRVSRCMQPGIHQTDRSFYGRGQMTKPRKRRHLPQVPKHSRPGEVEQTCGFLNRASANWFKQLRRLQSYKHAILSDRHQENYHSRAALWNSIVRAHGFKGGFAAWWTCRPHKQQGAPFLLPALPPDAQVFQWIYDDFHYNYRCFEHYQWRRRQDSCRSKELASTQGLFAVTRKPAKYVLDCLEDTVSQSITVVDARQGKVSVPNPFPDQHVVKWTLQSQPASVKPVEGGYIVDSDFLLVDGQSLTCTTLVHDTQEIQLRFANLWTPRWTKHSHVPAGQWDQIQQFAEAHLPSGHISLPPVSISDWRRAVQKFKTSAATGPCGWTRNDLVNMRDHHVQSVLDFFRSLEQGSAWPKQWCVGLIHCLQKRDDSVTADGFRPITVMSLFYRVYAGIRSGQILAQLAEWSDHMQCGFLRKRQAADVWYFIGVCLEVSFQGSTPVHGLVADLVKAYNTLPRDPTFAFLRFLGVPSWFLGMWASHLSVFTRHFVVRRCTGDAILSNTGFPEGCPLACVAMTAVDLVWHTWQRVQTPRVIPLSYVDNFELVCDKVRDLTVSSTQLDLFCRLLDLSVDQKSLYAWSSCAAGRRELKDNGYVVTLGNRDLGGQVTYCRQLRNRVLTDRMSAVHPLFGKLRKARLPQGVKKINILQCIWPRALHGCEAVKVGVQHFDKLRSGVMQALHWNHAGASPLARLSLLNLQLDPEWYQLKAVVKMLRHQCRSNTVVRDWWRLFCTEGSEQETHGPFGKLMQITTDIKLHIDEELRVWFSENGFISLLHCSDTVLEWVLARSYQDSKVVQLAGREGFDGLQSGCEVDLTTSNDKSFGLVDQAHLMTARDGTFVANDNKAKFDTRISHDCVWCNTPDTHLHKLTECSRFDDVRAAHCDLFDGWDALPQCFQVHGWVPSNPWQPLVWEALITLPSGLTEYQFAPTGTTLHCFTDGSVARPLCAADALASWAVVVAGQGPLAWGPLPGIQKTIPRAEAFAFLSVVSWIEHFTGTVHIWIDNQGVVDSARDILRGIFDLEDVEHEDIWRAIQAKLQRISAEIHVHKVASHDKESNCESPVEDFARVWNNCADRQALFANLTRPAYFQRIWEQHQSFRAKWKEKVVQMTRYQKAIADLDCKERCDTEHEVDPDVSPLEFVWFHNSASLSVQLQPWVDNGTLFTCRHDAHFRSITAQFLSWIIAQDVAASRMRTVSLIEIYVAFRLASPRRMPLSVTDGGCRFSVVTFASDFSYFKKVVRLLFQKADISWGDSVALSFLRIYIPQQGVQVGWTVEVEDITFNALSKFVGSRPVVSAQSLAKPWSPEREE